jgi:uncharacterized glyoxalase superfamily protein PhnB
MRITPHIVVRDAARAAEWYAQALGAEERSRIPLPSGKLMSVELRFGDSTVMIADVLGPTATARSPTPLATDGASPSTCATSPTTRSCARPRKRSANSGRRRRLTE